MRVTSILCCCAALVACSSTQLRAVEPKVFRTQVESGKVRVSPLPAIPWQEVSVKLQPNFTVKNADAVLPLVLPNTTASEYIYRSATSGGVGVNLAGPSRSKTTTTKTTQDLASDTTTEGSSTVESVRTISAAEIPSIDRETQLGTGAPNASKVFEAGFDASLSYRAAAALYQEIQLLNTYLSARLSDSDKIPYLLRVQVSVDPSTKGQPIDISSRLWLDAPQCRDKTVAKCGSADDIDILPILIAENGERSANNRLLEAASQLEASLSALVSNQGLGAEFEQLKSELQELRGSDYNSLLNVALNSSKELQLNIGAAYSPTYGVEMRERTYDISFLVLLPREMDSNGLHGVNSTFKSIQVLESSSFINATTGRTLPLIDEKFVTTFSEEIDSELSVLRVSQSTRAQVKQQIKEGDIKPIFDLCADDSSSGRTCRPLGVHFRSIYDRLKNYEDTLAPNEATITIPKQKRILPTPQTAFAVDQAGKGLTATLVALPEFQLSEDFAAVLFAEKKKGGQNIEVAYPARSVELADRGVISLTFPSLADVGIEPPTSKAEIVLGFWDQTEDVLRRAAIARNAKQFPTSTKSQATFEMAPGSERRYPVVFDLKNTSKVTTEKTYTAAIIPKAPTVSDKKETSFRLLLSTKSKTSVSIPVQVTVKAGALQGVTLKGSTLDDPSTAPTGSTKLDVRDEMNRFIGVLNNTYEIALSGVTEEMEIEVEVAQLKRDGKVDSEQVTVLKFKTAK